MNCPKCNERIRVLHKNDCCQHKVDKYLVRYFDEPVETFVFARDHADDYIIILRLKKLILLDTKERIEKLLLLQ